MKANPSTSQEERTMWHKKRIWGVEEVATPEDLARKLTRNPYPWSLCTGFVVSGHPDYLFLNDSLSESGVFELAIVRGGLDATVRRQIESVTVSWSTERKMLRLIRDALAGRLEGKTLIDEEVSASVESRTAHSCGLCH
jgi:hypothetical protein